MCPRRHSGWPAGGTSKTLCAREPPRHDRTAAALFRLFGAILLGSVLVSGGSTAIAAAAAPSKAFSAADQVGAALFLRPMLSTLKASPVSVGLYAGTI